MQDYLNLQKNLSDLQKQKKLPLMSRRSPLKDKDATVNIEDLVPSLKARLDEIAEIYLNEFHTELVITSGKDGKHGDNSLHYQGKAVDLRIWNVLETTASP